MGGGGEVCPDVLAACQEGPSELLHKLKKSCTVMHWKGKCWVRREAESGKCMHLTEFGNVRKVLAAGVCRGGEETQDTLSSGGKHLCDLGGEQGKGKGCSDCRQFTDPPTFSWMSVNSAVQSAGGVAGSSNEHMQCRAARGGHVQ